MSQIRLAKLPDRTPVKVTIAMSPELGGALDRYAAFYHAEYGTREAAVDLLPAIIAAFLESDKAFGRWCRKATDRHN